jgi:hypothetical protein
LFFKAGKAKYTVAHSLTLLSDHIPKPGNDSVDDGKANANT